MEKIICIGRKDFQVKIRGQRIELSEIENTIKEINGIDFTVVIDRVNENGDKYLVSYFISNNEIEGRNIRDYLKTKLPVYMIPNYYIRISEIPITGNGKLDRKALPSPTKNDLIKEKYSAPQTDIEKIICKIYSEIFGYDINEVGRMNDFYEMGGDSFLAIKIIFELKKVIGLKLNIKDVMNHSKIYDISDFIEKNKKNVDSKYQLDIITPHNTTEYPITHLIYTFDSVDYSFENLKNTTNNMYQYYKLNENFELEKLKNVFNIILQRHKILSSVFEEKIENNTNTIYGRTRDNMTLEIEHYTKDNFEQFIRKFDITKDLLIRVAIIENSILAIDIDHKVADGYSLGILLDEINSLYNGKALEELPIQYTDYTIYFDEKIKANEFANQIDYYREIFDGNNDTVHLIEKNNQNNDDHENVVFKPVIRETDSEVYDVVNKIAKENNISKTALLLTVYSMVLAIYSGQSNIYSTIISSNRIHTHTEKLIGLFMKYMPIALTIKKDKSLLELIKEGTETLLTILNFDVPYLYVSRELNLPSSNISFKFDPYELINTEEQELLKAISIEETYQLLGKDYYLGKEFLEMKEESQDNSSPDINLMISETENTYKFTLLYNSTLYEENLGQSILNTMIDIIKDERNYGELYDNIFKTFGKLDNPYIIDNLTLNESSSSESDTIEECNTIENNVSLISDIHTYSGDDKLGNKERKIFTKENDDSLINNNIDLSHEILLIENNPTMRKSKNHGVNKKKMLLKPSPLNDDNTLDITNESFTYYSDSDNDNTKKTNSNYKSKFKKIIYKLSFKKLRKLFKTKKHNFKTKITTN
ncbi:hypothetical protein PIROE2DRAFT_8103 [Piromyces sp. E2]|nr:hypothetical protein PIROE2DRAFT_8103 [Piromyces sp. E2]|eukprot:OUM64960.1 hypothetical protein PIROE2DRAFT_8103 [Piromyces sp. E2]